MGREQHVPRALHDDVAGHGFEDGGHHFGDGSGAGKVADGRDAELVALNPVLLWSVERDFDGWKRGVGGCDVDVGVVALLGGDNEGGPPDRGEDHGAEGGDLDVGETRIDDGQGGDDVALKIGTSSSISVVGVSVDCWKCKVCIGVSWVDQMLIDVVGKSAGILSVMDELYVRIIELEEVLPIVYERNDGHICLYNVTVDKSIDVHGSCDVVVVLVVRLQHLICKVGYIFATITLSDKV